MINTHCARCEKKIGDGHYVTFYINKAEGETSYTWCSACDDLAQLEKYRESGVLTTRLVMCAVLERVREVTTTPTLKKVSDDYEVIQRCIKFFGIAVWFNGLQRIVRESRSSGHSLKFGDFEMLVFSSAGRTMITLQTADSQVTMVADETSEINRTSFQGCRGTLNQICILFESINQLWATGTRTTPDNAVGMF